MKLATPLTKKRIRDHFIYNFWKYLLSAALCIFLWNMIYIQTEYRPPENKRIDVYVQTAQVTADEIDSFLKPVWNDAVPDMELVRSVVLMMSGGADYMSNMQLVTYLTAGEGDLYMLTAADFKRFAAQEAFLPLEQMVESGEIDATGIDTRSGWVTSQQTHEEDDKTVYTTEQHLYGIPAHNLKRFEKELGMCTDDLYIAVSVSNGNEDNVIAFLSYLIQWAQKTEN